MPDPTLYREDPQLLSEPIPLIVMHDGTVIGSWCSSCHDNTPHVYRPQAFRKLVCLRCRPDEVKS